MKSHFLAFICFPLVSLSLSPSIGFSQDKGLCYDSASKSSRLETQQETPPLTSLPRDVRHWMAMKASQLVYNLSDLEMAKNGADLVAQHAAFRSAALPNYEHWIYYSNRESGLKYVVFAPRDAETNPQAPWIFAFAGTQSSLDWMSDVSLGRGQLQKADEFADFFTDCRNRDRLGVPIAGRNWIITGHSLGGGLAQAFAFKSRSRRTLHRMVPDRIELVTFNGFGALDLMGRFAPMTRLEDTQKLTANYFVTGDVVSRIGQHLGPTYEIPLPPGMKAGAIRGHAMTTVEAAVMAEGYPRFDRFQEVAPPPSQTLQALKKWGRYFEFLTETKSENLNLQMEHVRVLREAADLVLKRGVSQKFDRDLLKYVNDIATGFLIFLKAMPQHDLRDPLIKDLERLQVRLRPYQ